MTESSSSTATTIISPLNDFENDSIELPPSLDIQSQRRSSIDTNINPSANVRKPLSSNPIISACVDQVTSKENSDMQNLKLY